MSALHQVFSFDVEFCQMKSVDRAVGINPINLKFQCCGSEDYTSWASSMFSRTELNESINAADNIFAVPQSCCIDPQSETCQQNRNITTNLHVEDFIHIQALFPFLSFQSVAPVVDLFSLSLTQFLF